jgi:hypothetical protein
MHVSVNGVRLFFDVEGAKFAPDGPDMREKPVLLMLHGGPGADHSIYRRPTPPWPMSRRSSTSTIAATAAARTARGRAGIWRNGATMSAPSARRWASPIQSCSALRSAAWSRWPMPPVIRTTLRS